MHACRVSPRSVNQSDNSSHADIIIIIIINVPAGPQKSIIVHILVGYTRQMFQHRGASLREVWRHVWLYA